MGSQLILAPVGLALVAGLVLLLVRRSWVAPWVVVPVLCLSAELQLRLGGTAGVLKDVVVLGMVLATGLRMLHTPSLLRRLRSFAAPLLAMAVVVGLYVLNPVGSHGLNWLSSLRLVLEAVGLLLVALLVDRPRLARRHLTLAVAVMAALEAAFAWAQQAVGQDTLIYSWGYQYGAQVRQSGSGGLRTSGTFAEPFSLAALGVVAMCLGLLVARRRLAILLVTSAVLIVGAASVRTAILQLGILALVRVLYGGWRVQAAVAAAAGLAAALLAGVLLTSSPYPGAPEKPLILGFNGRPAQWLEAIKGPESLVIGNGVAEVGSGSDRSEQGLVTEAAGAGGDGELVAQPDASTYLDSAYAQVQSDTGIVGTLALLFWLVGTLSLALRTVLARGRSIPAVGSGAVALLLACSLDWFGRTTLFAFPTGFLYLIVLGMLISDLPTKSSRGGIPAEVLDEEPSPPTRREVPVAALLADPDDEADGPDEAAPVIEPEPVPAVRHSLPPRRLVPGRASSR